MFPKVKFVRNVNHNHAADTYSTLISQKYSNALKLKAAESSHEPLMKIIRHELNAVESETLNLITIKFLMTRT